MSFTIYDIAERAGVSIATVSRVFNNSPRVSPRTRERVLAVAEELGYQPNISAQSLARQHGHLVAAVIPVLTNYFYMEVLRGMQDGLSGSDYDLVVYMAPRPEEVATQLERSSQKGRSEGLLLVSLPLSESRVRRLKASRVPVVVVDGVHADFDSVCVDNVKGGQMAAAHLVEQGYRHIAHITCRAESPPALQRRRGYEEALRAAGVKVEPGLVAASSSRPEGFVEEAGYEAMQALLHRKPRPDAVFAASDVEALGALQALQEAGLRPAEDVGLVGFDDIKVSRYVGLTTLRQPMYEMGRLAVEKLLRRLREPEHPITQTVFAPHLVVRSTTQRPAPVLNEAQLKERVGAV